MVVDTFREWVSGARQRAFPWLEAPVEESTPSVVTKLKTHPVMLRLMVQRAAAYSADPRARKDQGVIAYDGLRTDTCVRGDTAPRADAHPRADHNERPDGCIRSDPGAVGNDGSRMYSGGNARTGVHGARQTRHGQPGPHRRPAA